MTWNEEFDSILRGTLKYLGPEEPLLPASNLAELGLDSLELVGLLLSLEEKFEVHFPDAALTAQTFESPGNLWATLCDVMAGTSPEQA